MLVLLAVEASAVKEGSGFLQSRRILDRAITACAIKSCAIKACAIKVDAVKASSGSCHQDECGFLKRVRVRVIETGRGSRSRSKANQPRVHILFIVVAEQLRELVNSGSFRSINALQVRRRRWSAGGAL